ncbi:MAG: GIY-YIG nuclease family protein [bacterium]|nr:GIY-YIG nuclease family protein [bacterium]
MSYWIYILKCADNTLYIGSTNNLEKRVLHHNTAKQGARYTKSRRPVVLKYSEDCSTLSGALKREHALKKLSRKSKLELIAKKMPR